MRMDETGRSLKRISRGQVKDSGLAIVLILLLVGYFSGNTVYGNIAIVFLILTMAAPSIFAPFARLWIGISILLGTIMSKVVLSLVFYLLLTPIGLLRRLFGADPLQCKQWKKGRTSVFRVRDHLCTPEEIDRPY